MENVDFYDELKIDYISFENLQNLQDLLKELHSDDTVKNKENYRRLLNAKIKIIKKGLRNKGFKL